MKKSLPILPAIASLWLLLPTGTVFAVSETQLNASVSIVCPDGQGNQFSGTGTIIDSGGIILTNRHIVTDKLGKTISSCFVGLITGPEKPPVFGAGGEFNVAEVKFVTDTKAMDAAILYMNNPKKLTFPSVDVWNGDTGDLKLGQKIEIIGFPVTGGSTVTYTSGDFSGFGSLLDGTQNYLKTTAPFEHGNSGGAAYDVNGRFLGVPSKVVTGSLNSLGYILSVRSIKAWLTGVLGPDFAQVIRQQQAYVRPPAATLPSDVIPPALDGKLIDYEIINDDVLKQSRLRYMIPLGDAVGGESIKKIYYYFGISPIADPVHEGRSFDVASDAVFAVIPEDFILNEDVPQYFIVALQDDAGNVSTAITAPWDVASIIEAGRVRQVVQNERIMYRGTDAAVLKKFSGQFVENEGLIWWVSPKENVRYLVSERKMPPPYFIGTFATLIGAGRHSTGITQSDYVRKPRHVWGHFLQVFKDDMSGMRDAGCRVGCYFSPADGTPYDFSEQTRLWVGGSDVLLNIVRSLQVKISRSELNGIEPRAVTALELAVRGTIKEPPEYGFLFPDPAIAANVRGKILLDVEGRGEAWYVNPSDDKRYYMKDGFAAFGIMRRFSLGISDRDLAKIPTVGTSGSVDQQLIDRLKGAILLQVEQMGDAWYLNPADGRRYFLGRPEDAYRLMRTLSLGITKQDLFRIPVGQLAQ